jgi:hypothetical protein
MQVMFTRDPSTGKSCGATLCQQRWHTEEASIPIFAFLRFSNPANDNLCTNQIVFSIVSMDKTLWYKRKCIHNKVKG